MSRIQIPLDLITSRLNLGERLQGLRAGPLSGRFSNLRPISEFFDFKRLSKPANFGEVQSRVNYNLSHFSSNYAVVFVMLSLYALLTNWLLLFDIILVVFGMWFIGKLDGRDLEIGTFKATSSQLYTGLLVVSIPLGLIASPFSTLLWLIGASGVTILVRGRPRAPKFAPQWGRPSRRGRRKTSGDAAHYEDRVEELASDDDEEDGMSLGSGVNDVVRRRHRRRDTEEEDDSSSSGDGYDDDDSDDGEQDGEDEWEEALVQRALYRINKAQAKGRTDVRLSKEEIEALERRQRRMEAEERRNRRLRQERVSIPLSQFEPMARLGGSSRRHGSGSGSGPGSGSVSRQPSGGDALEGAEASPQMGYFPPPSGSRPRPKPGAAASRPSSIHEDAPKDPFQYQTAGPREPHAAPKRHGSGQSDLSSMSRRGRPESTSGWSQQGSSRRQSSNDTSEEPALAEESSNQAARGREDMVVEAEAEPRPGPKPASSRTRSATRLKPEPAPAVRRTASSRTSTGSGASVGLRRKKRE
ncbi:prenylated rab acceptor 1 [Trichoderma cornu-damae]|uniref:Prenylated rab acceptor 1 n=1 Tax=Trichoderma cornu-damae TaxID=654480 RepID=A0A9P8QK22_9HYPO|nr:prenylated rab acceptor 1 [Trichoderma cornu-damae]